MLEIHNQTNSISALKEWLCTKTPFITPAISQARVFMSRLQSIQMQSSIQISSVRGQPSGSLSSEMLPNAGSANIMCHTDSSPNKVFLPEGRRLMSQVLKNATDSWIQGYTHNPESSLNYG